MTIYEAFFDDLFIACGLTNEAVMQQLKTHWAYGPVGETSYTKGNKWATSVTETGTWRVRRGNVDVVEILGDKKGVPVHETAHIIWMCPLCSHEFSDDFDETTEFPILRYCRCSRESHSRYYVLIHCKSRLGKE